MADKPKWMSRLPAAASDEQAFAHWFMLQSKVELRGPEKMAEAAWFAALQWREVAHGVLGTQPAVFVWSEVLDSDLPSIEETPRATTLQGLIEEVDAEIRAQYPERESVPPTDKGGA